MKAADRFAIRPRRPTSFGGPTLPTLYLGRALAILKRRETIKRKTVEQRRRLLPTGQAH
jgi:hypothetical protein